MTDEKKEEEKKSTNSILTVGEGSSVLGIRVGVPYLTQFDVRRGSTLEGGSTLGVALMRSVSRGDRRPCVRSTLSIHTCNYTCIFGKLTCRK